MSDVTLRVALGEYDTGMGAGGQQMRGRALGGPGLGLAALVVVLLGLVSSGGPAGSEFLPDFYRSLGPWMPPGQLYDAFRGALYFDGAALGGPVLVLTGWLIAGLLLMGLGEVVSRSRAGKTAKATAG